MMRVRHALNFKTREIAKVMPSMKVGNRGRALTWDIWSGRRLKPVLGHLERVGDGEDHQTTKMGVLEIRGDLRVRGAVGLRRTNRAHRVLLCCARRRVRDLVGDQMIVRFSRD